MATLVIYRLSKNANNSNYWKYIHKKKVPLAHKNQIGIVFPTLEDALEWMFKELELIQELKEGRYILALLTSDSYIRNRRTIFKDYHLDFEEIIEFRKRNL